MKTQFFHIIVEKDADGYFVFCPQLQGCYSQGETYEEALDNIQDAIRLHLEDRNAQEIENTENKSVSLTSVAVTF